MKLTFRVLIAFTTPIVVVIAYLASLSLQADLPHREDKVVRWFGHRRIVE